MSLQTGTSFTFMSEDVADDAVADGATSGTATVTRICFR